MHRFLLLVMLLSATTLLHAHTKTPWGDPDLQGVWSNQTPTPLERPDALAGKTTFSEQEATEFERTSLERLLTVFTREVPISGELNEIWLETAKGRVPPGRSTSLIVDPPDGKVPFTTEGQKRWDALPKMGKPMLANGPEDRTQAERCITTDGLLVPNPFYNNYFEIVQAPGYVAIVTEMMHETRVIPLDQRPRVGSSVRMWSGDSRGWWEGETGHLLDRLGADAGQRAKLRRQQYDRRRERDYSRQAVPSARACGPHDQRRRQPGGGSGEHRGTAGRSSVVWMFSFLKLRR